MDEPRFDHSSRSRLTKRDLGRFTGDTLFDRVARVVCGAECLPRKELYESWEVARRARRRFRGGRVLDLACGHGLIAHLMLLLDDSSGQALAVDRVIPPSASTLSAALTAEWPRLAGRISFLQAPLETVTVSEDDVLVSAHACGGLSDVVIELAIGARARLSLLPCCHDTRENDLGGLEGWLDPALAIDVARVARLRAASYVVHTQRIPVEITEKNRLLLAAPAPLAPSP